MKRIILALALTSVAVPAVAQVTTRYVYDARGRLVGVGNLGGATNGNAVRINHDAADNRTYYQSWNVIVQLSPGQQITSPDGRFRLVQQGDGNLVLYFGSQALWANGVFGANYTTYLQGDGNFVTYSPSGPVWNTETNAIGARLALQNDGNLVIYDLDDRVVWATNTGGH
jgi:YD repeat-containing protein